MTTPDSIPAVLGGTPVRPEGPPDWPIADEDVALALQAAYRDGCWGKYHGIYVERLEKRLAQCHGMEFAATCGSGTFAVELALRALKIGPGDEVVLAAYDYGGNFLNVHAVGAMPVLVDVDPANWNLDPDRLAAAVGPKTRAVIVSHLHGGLVPMREVMELAAAHGLRVIEDAAQVPGGIVQGRMAGTWGDVGILSFGGSKLVTAGRGGAMLTRHADVNQRARLWLNRTNEICPLSELQAAVLLPQLEKLDARNHQRAANVQLLSERLRELAVPWRRLINRCVDSAPAYYKLGFQYDPAGFHGLSRERFIAAMRAEGIAFDEGFRALHVGRSPRRFRTPGLGAPGTRLAELLTEATKAHDGAIVLHHPVLLGDLHDIEQVAQAVHKIHQHSEKLRQERVRSSP